MDRERLKEVKTTDLAEANVNEEFVEWLKTKGLSWLLVILIALVVYLGIVRWRQGKDRHHFAAWQALSESGAQPSSYESVADDYPDVDAVAELANLRAAQLLMGAVQNGNELGGDATGFPIPLTPELRDQYLDRADGYYTNLLDGTKKGSQYALLAVNALNGRAAVAEARDTPDEAKAFYLQAAERAEEWYPELAAQARLRAESVNDRMITIGKFPAASDIRVSAADMPERRSVVIDPALTDLLLPTDQN